MNCQEVKEFSSDYLDGRLAPSQAILLEEHANICSACAREVTQLRATISLMGSLDGIETAPDFVAQVNRKIDRDRNPSRLWSWLVEPMRIKLPLEVAALVLVSTLAFYLYHRSPEMSQDRLTLPDENFLMARKAPDATGVEQKKEAQAKPPADQAPKARGAIQRGVPLATAPDALTKKEMRSQEREVVAALKEEPQATELAAAREGEAKRFSLEAGKVPAAAPVEADQQRSKPAPAALRTGMGVEIAKLAPSPQVLEVVTEDVAGSQRQIKSLVEELGGKIVSERVSDEGLLVALELPQSRQAEFQSAVKQEPGRRQRETSAFWEPPEPASESLPRVKGSVGAAPAALSQAKKYTQEKDEPTVKLEVRIRRKR